ncbi:AraC family transcriptional regulator [Flavobacteriaceae bacterium F89]|uniref:AraC family transcriptional regulator n=1 Tax=Cerina litoralis TaxID=2874477 RepID=A0AAE3EWC2_9FLAO|nr:AraC family transcriptional regulator [Cerina litoralis]MCG2461478.1 AraC family transcriptional regulator [Cerina litoralis]
MDKDFIIQKPFNSHLQSLVDYYFFIDIPITELKIEKENVIPFPRITFGYFFEHPFSVTNHTTEETIKAEMIISRISTNQISVRPLTDRVKIIGAHVRPYTLAYLTDENISEMPWLIKTGDLFGKNAQNFKKAIDKCTNPKNMFAEVENIFLRTILAKDLSLITSAINIVESEKGDISIGTLSEKIGVSNRTLRNHFYKSMGCSPKEYIHLVKLKQSIYQMKYSTDSLTSVSYSQNYADQAHFTNTVKNITGASPKKIRKEIPDFRFLQF